MAKPRRKWGAPPALQPPKRNQPGNPWACSYCGKTGIPADKPCPCGAHAAAAAARKAAGTKGKGKGKGKAAGSKGGGKTGGKGVGKASKGKGKGDAASVDSTAAVTKQLVTLLASTDAEFLLKDRLTALAATSASTLAEREKEAAAKRTAELPPAIQLARAQENIRKKETSLKQAEEFVTKCAEDVVAAQAKEERARSELNKRMVEMESRQK